MNYFKDSIINLYGYAAGGEISPVFCPKKLDPSSCTSILTDGADSLTSACAKKRSLIDNLHTPLLTYDTRCAVFCEMTLTSFVFTELDNTVKYGGGVLYNLIFTE